MALEHVVSLVNLGMRRTGLSRGTEDERDVGQVRLAIDGIRAMLPLLEQTAPDGLRYATLVLEDGVSFVHLASHVEDDGGRLTELAAFKRFQEGLGDRCEEAPVLTEMRQVGNYRLFG